MPLTADLVPRRRGLHGLSSRDSKSFAWVEDAPTNEVASRAVAPPRRLPAGHDPALPPGLVTAVIASLLGYDPLTVRRWLHRYNRERVMGLID
jgi:hypothetical protein